MTDPDKWLATFGLVAILVSFAYLFQEISSSRGRLYLALFLAGLAVALWLLAAIA